MQTVQEIYAMSISHLPSLERLRLAALILNELAVARPAEHQRQSIQEMLEEMPSEGLFKTSAEVDEYLERERDSWER